MEMGGLIIGIASSVVATLLTSFSWYCYNHFQNRDRLLIFLGMKNENNLSICYGNVQSGPSDLYQSPLNTTLPVTSFDYGDIDATLIVYNRISTKFRGKIQHYSNNIPDVMNSGNIIAIGGPKWNKATETLLGKVGSPFYYFKGVEGLIERRSSHHSENIHKYSIKNNEEDRSVEIADFGIIVCARHSYLGSKLPFAMIVSGYSTFGVLIAARYLNEISDDDFQKLKMTIKQDKRFCILVKGSVKIDEKGKYLGSISTELLSWIHDQDFHPPYDYKYDKPFNVV